MRKLTPPLIWNGAWKLKGVLSTPKLNREMISLVRNNIKLKDKHKGKRIFILGTGPSIKEQNLLPLKNEICIGLNEFYLHPNLNIIQPTYMFFSGFSVHPNIADKAFEWYKNFELHIKTNSIAILNIQDHYFLKQNKLLVETEKYFVNDFKSFDELKKSGFHAEKFSYGSQNVAIMALQMALYMGASEIFLLGCDHDWILTALENRQNHFYDDSKSIIYKSQEKASTRNIFTDLLHPYYVMFQQYQIINDYVNEQGKSKIYNASKRTLLDIFEKKNLEDII